MSIEQSARPSADLVDAATAGTGCVIDFRLLAFTQYKFKRVKIKDNHNKNYDEIEKSSYKMFRRCEEQKVPSYCF